MTEELDPKKLGDQCFAMGHYLEAAEAYQQHCDAHPEDGATKLQLGTSLVRSGEDAKGLDAYAEAAMVFARMKQVAKAIAAAKLIIEHAPNDERAKQLLVDISALTESEEDAGPVPLNRHPSQPVAPKISAPRLPTTGVPLPTTGVPLPTTGVPLVSAPRPIVSPSLVAAPRPISTPSIPPVGSAPRQISTPSIPPVHSAPRPNMASPVPPLVSAPRPTSSPSLPPQNSPPRPNPFQPVSVRPLPMPPPPPRITVPPRPPPPQTAERKPLSFPRLGFGPTEPSTGVSLNLDLPTPAVPEDRQDPANTLLGTEVGTDSWLQQIEIAAGALPRELAFDVTADLPDRSFDALTRLTLFSDLPPDLFVALSQECAFRIYAYGERIIEQGTVGDSFFVLVQGKAHVVRREGNDNIELAVLDEGEFFGEMALISGSPRNASVYAYSDETQLLEFAGETLKKLAVEHPSLAGVIRKFCRQRLLSNLLKVSPLLSPFDVEERRWLIQRFRSRDLKTGEVVVPSLDRCDGLYVILYGECMVRAGERVLSLIKEGESFDRRLFLDAGLTDASVIATRSASILRLPQTDYDELLQRHPNLATSVSKDDPPS